jgi:hypothetical protein
MTKLELTTNPKAKRASARPQSVTIKTVRSDQGEKVRVLAMDANSESFSDDFLYAFTRNVRQARKENKEQLGTTSGVRPAP